MRYPRLVVYETDRRLATWLREAVDVAEMLRFDADGRPVTPPKPKGPRPSSVSRGLTPEGWLLHETRQPAACMRLLQKGGPTVLIIQLTKDATVELELLEQANRRIPDALSVVVGEEAHRSLAPLAWDLGATAVLLPPRVGERLQEIVLGFMKSVMARALADASDELSDEG
jgi:hypothetical protein